MRQTRSTLLAFLLLATRSGLAQQQSPVASELAALSQNLPFVMPSVPVPFFPDRSVTNVHHQAIADGVTVNAKAFAPAIDVCAQAGGSTLVVPVDGVDSKAAEEQVRLGKYVNTNAVVQTH